MEITNVIISDSYFDFLLKNKGLFASLGITFFIIIMIVGAIFCSYQIWRRCFKSTICSITP